MTATTRVVHEDLPYTETAEGPLLARVYRPAGAHGPLPALVDVHGGAWRWFDRTADAVFDRALAASGMLVVALDFRMAPGHRWPASLDDVRAGVRFVRANADRLGALPDPIGLIGGSSGGHLALWAAICPGSKEASVAYALPLWPIADPIARYRYAKARIGEAPAPGRDRFFEPERLVCAQDEYFGSEAAMADASVPRLLDEGAFERLPLLWVAHPERDENVTLAMTQDWVTRYRARGGSVELEIFPGVGHSFANFPGEATDRCIERMCEFVARQLVQWTDSSR